MNYRHTSLLLASCLILSSSLQALAVNIKDDPAYLDIDSALDLKTIKPAVNVNIPRFLLNSALSEFNGENGDPIAALGLNLKELTQDVKLIRLVVLEADDDQEKDIEIGLAKLREELEDGWIAIVSVPEENVFVYARSDASGEQLAGLALLVADGNDVVIGNLVGNVPIGKIAKIAAKMGGDMIPADLLSQLGGLAHPEATHHAEEDDHDEAHAEAHAADDDTPEQE